jgi:DNA-binding IscR family transcriptional regulator
MLSREAKYAIRALTVLPQIDGELLRGADIPSSESFSQQFLYLIRFELRGHGVARSTRRRHGGYGLAVLPVDRRFPALVDR